MRPIAALKSLFSNALASIRARRHGASPKRRLAADALLSDAVRLAELPSPVSGEEPRIAFIAERLKSGGLAVRIDGVGNLLASLPAPGSRDARCLLVHACVGTKRWHPLRSYARLDAERASGAGLADALPSAVLLALAEAASAGAFAVPRNLVFAFVARSPEDADSDAYGQLVRELGHPPVAVVGLRGTASNLLPGKPLGAVRFSVAISQNPEDKAAGGSGGRGDASAVTLAVDLAGRLEGMRWDASGATRCTVARIEAGAGFGRPPRDAVVEIELESADQGVLDLAAGAVGATAAKIGETSAATVIVREASRLPVHDAVLSAPLAACARAAMKEVKIHPVEASFADSAACFSSRGIAALSIGVSDAVEGIEFDELRIDSLAAGYRLAELALGKAMAAFDEGGRE
ncbi:MAG: hypothetical protein JXA15_00730 [Spirochaetales bacterium]|nr:hypothetical protein [Spirochaetales bacterium]